MRLISPGSSLFFSDSASSAETSRLVKAGKARKIAPRLYSTDLETPPEDQVRQELWGVVAGYAPGAVITDRTGFEAGVHDGSVTLVVPENANDQSLPGLRIRKRIGPGRLSGDQPFMGGLFLASEARRFLDNLRLTRARGGYRRALTREELEERLIKLLQRQGEDALNGLRDGARALAPSLNAAREFTLLEGMISALLRTGPNTARTAAGRAVANNSAFDSDRLPLFDELLRALIRYGSVEREDVVVNRANFAFWEAYFSNYIEGTDFPVDEAERIVFEGYEPPDRPKDARDVLGTFALAVGPQRAQVPQSPQEFVQILADEHGQMLASRPEISPGVFKTESNQAGNTVFVDPRLVAGTLHQGYERIAAAPAGFAKAVMTMFVVSEVHPFVDGNGRMARLRMNAELTTVGQQRIIIPTAYQQDYLGSLRRLSRSSDPTVLIRALDRAQQYAHQVVFGPSRSATEVMLEATNAFDPEKILTLPGEIDATRRSPLSLSSAAHLALSALRVFPDQNTPAQIANGPLGVDQIDVTDTERGLSELAEAGLAQEAAAGRWSLVPS